MAANQQHMAAAGQMMPQQGNRRQNPTPLQQYVYQNLVTHTPPQNGVSWQSHAPIQERMGKVLNLITNITLAMNVDGQRAADYACTFERDMFLKSPSKEQYDQAMANKRMEFFRKRQANEPHIQNSLNANMQAQAQQAAQAQAMMNMQAQMGRGQGPQQGFGHLQHQMQPSQIPQQPQQQQQQPQQTQQPQQMGMGMGMNMGGQAGRGMGANPQMGMGVPAEQNRPQQQFPNANEMSRLAPADKARLSEVAAKLMANAPEDQKAELRIQLEQRMPAQQLADFQASGKDPIILFYQNQAFQYIRNNQAKFSQQGRPQNQNAAQAAMMQQQHSQQALQQRQSMANGVQQAQAGGDFSPFASMESIKDQQLNGLMAQQAGLMVVPASAGGPRNPTPQSANQNLPPNQPGPNQTPRPAQQQPIPQQQTAQQTQQQGINLQQMKMNQAAQQTQAQLQAQHNIKQMQGQQPGMGGAVPPSQSPGMNNLNAPASRQPNGMNPMGGQGMGQGNVQFGDQRFNRPNNQMLNLMLSNMSPEQRQAVNGLPPEKLQEVLRKWQSQREQAMLSNGGQMNQLQMQNVQGQYGRMPQNMPGPTQGMPPQQMGAQGNNAQMQMQGQRPPPQNTAAQAMMDAMDLPPQVLNQISQLPHEVKKWKDLKVWLSQNSNALPPQIRSSLSTIQGRQFHLAMQRRAGANGQGQVPGQPGQVQNMNPGMPTPGGQNVNMQQAMQRPPGSFPPQVLQVSPQELIQVRSRQPQFANMSDDELRVVVVSMKKQSWTSQQQQQMQMRAQQASQGQQGMPNQMSMPQAGMQLKMPPQTNLMAQNAGQAQPGGPTMGNVNAMQNNTQKPARTPDAVRQARQPQPNKLQPPQPSPAQPAKNLKRPSTDDTAEANRAAVPARPMSQQQPNQPGQNQRPPLTQHEVNALPPDQRARYEQMLRAQASSTNGQAQGAQSELLQRLRQLGQEERQKFAQETIQEILMTPQEYMDTSTKLRAFFNDMNKIGKGLNKWYIITRDDQRARMFFKVRMRVLSQYGDGEKGEEAKVHKDKFSIRSAELDVFRAMLESMAKDLAASVQGRKYNRAGQQATPQNAAAQLPQQQAQQPQQPAQPEPSQNDSQPDRLNKENLENHAKAMSKMKKGATKANQAAPAAPTNASAPFSFNQAGSPHGQPNYIGKAKEMNLKLPPSKRQKPNQPSGSQGATPSPSMAKNASPEMQRQAEPQQPPKPTFLCKDPECDKPNIGFPSDKALQRHVEEEHTKPRENPVKFVGDILATVLGLEADGSVKKEHKMVAPPMSATTSKQGQTPGNLTGTPKSQDAVMKRSASALGKPAGKGLLSKAVESKQAEAQAAAAFDPWASATIDPQSLLRNLGFENGVPGVISDMNAFRSLTPKDTPGSSKDGASEPNSDISDGAGLDIEVRWQSLDTDLLLDLNNTSLEGNMPALDAMIDGSMSHLGAGGIANVDWDDFEVDFSKPFQLDTSLYSMPM